MADGSLKGKVALITGAGSNPGMGRIMALAMVRAGARVAMSDVNANPLARSVNDAREIGGDDAAMAIVADVSSQEDAERAVTETIENFGGLHILVNNAGINPAFTDIRANRSPNFWEINPALWARMIAVNLGGAFLMSRAAVPHLLEQKWGRIISVTTSLDTMIRGHNAPYGPSKAGHEAFAAVMANELEGTGVTANVLVPGGAADTNFIPFLPETDRTNFINPEVMAAPAVWLASDASNDINGMRIRGVDWDESLSIEECLSRSSGPTAWPQLGRSTGQRSRPA
jgi:NAD(P)-dependent dehydrogenase (short-subunit alcohol dehydrogenase family)